MELAFLDTIPWQYDAATPYERPLGGSQSALCYLVAELARLGHSVTLYTGTRRATVVRGVNCLPHNDCLKRHREERVDAFVCLNGPAVHGLRLREIVAPGSPLILWNQHAADQSAIEGLASPAVRRAWDAVVCISTWQRDTLLQQFALDPTRVFLIPSAVGPAFNQTFSSTEELASAKAGAPVLAYTSTPFRGLDVLLAVFPRIRKKWPTALLRVYSSMKVYQQSDEEDAYRDLYVASQATPGVTYIGSLPQPELAQALRDVSFLAYPNIFAETYCIAAAEAIASGVQW